MIFGRVSEAAFIDVVAREVLLPIIRFLALNRPLQSAGARIGGKEGNLTKWDK